MDVARASTSEMASKKRKVHTNGESIKLPSSTSCVELKKKKKQRQRGVVSSSISQPKIAAESVQAGNDDVSMWDHVETSCCSSSGSSELVQEKDINFVDLKDEEEEEGDQVESWTYDSSRERREMTAPTSELHPVESDGVESTEADSIGRSAPTVVAPKNTQMEAELEEFFAAAEKDIRTRFLQKYNYHIGKDEPVEGRYEWVRLKP